MTRIGPGPAGRAGLLLTAGSVTLTFATAVAGPSVMEPALPGTGGQPPWALGLRISPYLAAGLAAAALALGTLGLTLTLRAVRRGWLVPARAILLAGLVAAVALALVPPFGSADHLSYAAYGRMVITGHDPYTTTPAMLARLGDPVARAVQDWRGTPSVYGSVATAGEALASRLGGTSVRLTVFVLSLCNVAAFAAAGLLLHWLTRGTPARQLRAALVWTSNPLLLQVLVAGAHVDSQAIMFGVTAVAVTGAALARRPAPDGAALAPPGRWAGSFGLAAIAGVTAGLGASVKLSMVLVPAGLVAAIAVSGWARRPCARKGWRHPATAAAGLAAGFAVSACAGLVPWGPGSLTPALRAGSMVSDGSPWRTVRLLHFVIGPASASDVVKAGAITLMLTVLALFIRPVRDLAARLAGAPPPAGHITAAPTPAGPIPAGPTPAGLDGVGAAAEVTPAGLTGLAAACAFTLAFAWLAAWPYVLPWYDGLAWALLALLPWVAVSGTAGPVWAALDWLVLARTAVLSFGYLPARGIALPAALEWEQRVVRLGVTPVVLLAVTVVLLRLLWCQSRSGRVTGSFSGNDQTRTHPRRGPGRGRGRTRAGQK